MELEPCTKCGYEVFAHVNYYGDNKYKFEVECTHCDMSWLSKNYTGAAKAYCKGIESWNNMPRKKKRK